MFRWLVIFISCLCVKFSHQGLYLRPYSGPPYGHRFVPRIADQEFRVDVPRIPVVPDFRFANPSVPFDAAPNQGISHLIQIPTIPEVPQEPHTLHIPGVPKLPQISESIPRFANPPVPLQPNSNIPPGILHPIRVPVIPKIPQIPRPHLPLSHSVPRFANPVPHVPRIPPPPPLPAFIPRPIRLPLVPKIPVIPAPRPLPKIPIHTFPRLVIPPIPRIPYYPPQNPILGNSPDVFSNSEMASSPYEGFETSVPMVSLEHLAKVTEN